MGNNEMTTRNRDNFDPKPHLKNLEGGEKVIVIDSNDPKHLPKN